jgi:hypothetical protein
MLVCVSLPPPGLPHLSSVSVGVPPAAFVHGLCSLSWRYRLSGLATMVMLLDA